jgi:hypothetical protein
MGLKLKRPQGLHCTFSTFLSVYSVQRLEKRKSGSSERVQGLTARIFREEGKIDVNSPPRAARQTPPWECSDGE